MDNRQNPPIIQYLKLSIDLRKELFQKVKEEINELIKFIVSLMGTLGIIAGFGFTAFQHILSPSLFFLGEILVIGTILYLGFKTKKTLVDLAVDTQGYVNHWVQKGTEIRKSMVDKNESEIKRLENELSENIDSSDPPKKFIGAEVVGEYLNRSLWLGAIGIFLIILSFFLCI